MGGQHDHKRNNHKHGVLRRNDRNGICIDNNVLGNTGITTYYLKQNDVKQSINGVL